MFSRFVTCACAMGGLAAVIVGDYGIATFQFSLVALNLFVAKRNYA